MTAGLIAAGAMFGLAALAVLWDRWTAAREKRMRILQTHRLRNQLRCRRTIRRHRADPDATCAICNRWQ